MSKELEKYLIVSEDDSKWDQTTDFSIYLYDVIPVDQIVLSTKFKQAIQELEGCYTTDLEFGLDKKEVSFYLTSTFHSADMVEVKFSWAELAALGVFVD